MTPRGKSTLWAGLLFLSFWAPLRASGIKIAVIPGSTECFDEMVEHFHFDVPQGVRIDGRLMVSGKSQYYVPFISVQLFGPQGQALWHQDQVYSEAHFNVAAAGPGHYKLCFANPADSRTVAVVDLVYFTAAHLRRAPGKVVVPRGTSDARNKEMAHKEDMDNVQHTITSINEFVQVISGSQKYLQRKLDKHYQTVVSSKNRTLNYAMLEMLVFMAAMAVQIIVITKLFESRRVKNLSV